MLAGFFSLATPHIDDFVLRTIFASMTSRIQAAKARKDFANVVRRSAKGERIKLTRYGQTLAVVIPKSDLEALEDCEQDSAHAHRRR